MIDNHVSARLTGFAPLTALVGTNIYPAVPTDNTQLPVVVHTVTSSETQLHTQGISDLTRYTLDLDIWAVNLSEVQAVADQCKAALHGYRGGVFQGAFLQTYLLTSEPAGHHMNQTYIVWAKPGNIVATPDATGIVRTGNQYVEISACDHTLRLDCEGLTLDGDEVGGTPDLSGYAQTGTENTFSEAQFFVGGIGGGGSPLIVDSQGLYTVGTITSESGFIGDGSQLTNLPTPDLSDYARKSQANTWTTGTQTINTGAAGNKGLVVKGHSGQTANVLEVQNSGGTATAYVDSQGRLVVGGSNAVGFGNFGSGLTEINNANGGGLYLRSWTPGILYGGGLVWREYDGNEYLKTTFRQQGGHPGLISTWYNPSGGANGDRHIVCTSHASQTSNTIECRDGSNNPTWAVDAKGGVKLASLTDSAANNSTLFFSTDAGKPAWKDSGGTVHALY